MVVLYAFSESCFCEDDDIPAVGRWFPIARFDTLRQLDKEKFQFFKKFYNGNLALRYEF